MKLTQKIIEDLEKALDMRKKNGDPIWDDGDDIDVIELGDGYTVDRNDLNTYPPSQTRPRERPEGIKNH